MNRETADAIKKIGNRYIPNGDMFWDFCIEVSSLIVEDEHNIKEEQVSQCETDT